VGLAVLLSGVALYSALYAVVPLLPLLERLFGAPPGAAGRRGPGVSGAYVAAFYLGGTLAGLLYPLFLHSFPLAVGLGAALALLALLLAPVG